MIEEAWRTHVSPCHVATIAASVLMVSLAVATFDSGTAVGVPVPAAATGTLQTVSLELPAAGGQFVPFYVGQKDGIYAKYGIDLKISVISPGVVIPSLLSGKLDFTALTGTVAGAAISGQRVKVFEISSDHSTLVLVGPKTVASVQQLAGKTIVGESPASSANLIEQLILQHYGVLSSSVSVINVSGSDDARVALVEAGKASATVTDLALFEEGLNHGEHLHIISNPTFVTQPYAGLAAATSYVSANTALTKRMIDATIEATYVATKDEARTVPVIESEFDLTKAQARSIFPALAGMNILTGRPSEVAIQNELKSLEQTLHLSKVPNASSAFDFSLLPKEPPT
jgi:ABC-type nitrate/sulfonate/bicarbonate transport system substrate-binding protein